MAPGIHKDYMGPIFPLGFIGVVTPGTPVNIMSLVDPLGANNPATPDPSPSSGIAAGLEFPIMAMNAIFQAVKPGVTHGTQANTGNVYVLGPPVSPGAGNRDDTGDIYFSSLAGQTLPQFLFPGAGIKFSPYEIFVDGDSAGDGYFVTLFLPA